MNFFSAFKPNSRPETQWFPVGLASSFPDIGVSEDEEGDLSQPRTITPCSSNTEEKQPGCKAFHIPKQNPSEGTQVNVSPEEMPPDLTDQVLVFKHKGKIHAIDHSCPHSSFPLSQGTPFDIEDFGIVLSAGITCPKHGWSFDLFSGRADRGNYRLKVWEVELRDAAAAGEEDKEVWVRRKQRIG
ncbi:hypothetical protein QBC38DRAFT_200573 [Podospora fimiseda]|uniref:Rieske domain-containing protein n=1 Tax=Podospora fimiseda TaxID=252190 RepID=A0AAN7GYN6_9PEZI|nr:hypothetical protein QBC38DRAFT_200573 [Podospora fimiseda]